MMQISVHKLVRLNLNWKLYVELMIWMLKIC